MNERVLSTALFAAVCGLVTVFAVLPAERAWDPTGVGAALGLTQLGEIKLASERGTHPLVDQESAFQEEVVTLILAPGEGVEVKALMRSTDQILYAWSAEAPLYFDLHAEPAGQPADVFESFQTGTTQSAEGVYTPPFDGSHGWYWKNDSADAVAVELRVTGTYARVERR